MSNAAKKDTVTTPVESAFLGTVTWNDARKIWEATVAFAPDQSVGITLEPLETNEDQTLANGEALVQWAKECEPEVRAYAAEQLTDLAEEWREEEEEPDPITPESFAVRITLEGITAGSDGGATCWYNDDDIFARHVIVVSINADRQCTDAQIMG